MATYKDKGRARKKKQRSNSKKRSKERAKRFDYKGESDD